MNAVEVEAQTAAENQLRDKYPDEFEEIFRVTCLKRGLNLVKIRRTITKVVSEAEAELLCRPSFGWERVPE